jgi:hypothetical protein
VLPARLVRGGLAVWSAGAWRLSPSLDGAPEPGDVFIGQLPREMRVAQCPFVGELPGCDPGSEVPNPGVGQLGLARVTQHPLADIWAPEVVVQNLGESLDPAVDWLQQFTVPGWRDLVADRDVPQEERSDLRADAADALSSACISRTLPAVSASRAAATRFRCPVPSRRTQSRQRGRLSSWVCASGLTIGLARPSTRCVNAAHTSSGASSGPLMRIASAAARE